MSEFTELKEEVLATAEQALKYVHDLSIPSAEIFVVKRSTTEVKSSKGKVETRDGIVKGVGIRVAVGKRVGFSSCTSFNSDLIRSTLIEAFNIAKSSPENPRFPGFASSSKPGKDGLLDPDVISLDGEILGKQVTTLEKECVSVDERILGAEIEASADWGAFAVGTTEGVLEATLNTVHAVVVSALAFDKGERSGSFEVLLGRKAQDITGLGEKAAKNALKHLGSKPLGKAEVITTVWHPITAGMLYAYAFALGFNGGEACEKRNPLGTKLNEQIGTEGLTLIDDAQDPEKITTYAIDTEGVGTRNTTIVEKGVLKTFLFDRLYGETFGVGSTGNADRMGHTPFEEIPRIMPHKIIFAPGTKNLEKQIEECERAIYIEGNLMGIGHANYFTGDFSITATNAYLIEHGEIVRPLAPLSIAGNFYKSLKQIKTIGSDIIPNFNPVDAPTLTIEGLSISG